MQSRFTRREMLRTSLAVWPSLSLLPASSSYSSPPGATPSDAAATELFHDDFSGLPAGWLSQPLDGLNSAIQEFHWIPRRALPHGAWSNGVVDQDAWLVSSEDGKSYMQQQLFHPPDHVNAVLIAGEKEWRDYAVEVKVKPLLLEGIAGIAFRYQTNRQYYVFGLSGGNLAQLMLQHPIAANIRIPNWETVASAPFSYTVEQYYGLRVENQGPHIRAYIDGKLVLEAVDEKLMQGKVGITRQYAGALSGVSRGCLGRRSQRHRCKHPPPSPGGCGASGR